MRFVIFPKIFISEIFIFVSNNLVSEGIRKRLYVATPSLSNTFYVLLSVCLTTSMILSQEKHTLREQKQQKTEGSFWRRREEQRKKSDFEISPLEYFL